MGVRPHSTTVAPCRRRCGGACPLIWVRSRRVPAGPVRRTQDPPHLRPRNGLRLERFPRVALGVTDDFADHRLHFSTSRNRRGAVGADHAHFSRAANSDDGGSLSDSTPTIEAHCPKAGAGSSPPRPLASLSYLDEPDGGVEGFGMDAPESEGEEVAGDTPSRLVAVGRWKPGHWPDHRRGSAGSPRPRREAPAGRGVAESWPWMSDR